MHVDRQDLISLIGSRICHDLISPLGAISNGLELLSMSGIEASPELALINESIENANSKIRFFRVAYGKAATQALLSMSEIKEILGDYFKGSRVSLTWQVKTAVPRVDVKMVFLAIQCLQTALPYGGQIVVRQKDGRWILTVAAEKLKADPGLWCLVDGQRATGEVGAHEVQFAMLALLAEARGSDLRTVFSDQAMTLEF